MASGVKSEVLGPNETNEPGETLEGVYVLFAVVLCMVAVEQGRTAEMFGAVEMGVTCANGIGWIRSGLLLGDDDVDARAEVLFSLLCVIGPEGTVDVVLRGIILRGTMGAKGLISIRDGRSLVDLRFQEKMLLLL